MKLFLDDGGSGGVPVVLVHGLAADHTVWSAQLDHLRASRRVLAPDLRGHGRSPKAADYNVQACVDDLLETLPPLPKFWLVGHSFSGTVVSTVAGQHPDKLAGVVYLDATGDVSNPPPEVVAWFERQHEGLDGPRLQALIADMIGPKGRPETRRHLVETASKMDVPAFAALRLSMVHVPARELLAKFHGPKFAIEQDDVPEEMKSRIGSALPDVKRLTIPNVSHWMMLDDPHATNRALDEVLR